MKITASPAVIDFYTDILAHSFESGGQRLAACTTTGKVIVLERDWEKNEAFAKMETLLPQATPALCLDWKNSKVGIFVGARSLLSLFRPNHNGDYDGSTPIKFEVMYNVQDVASGPSGSVVFGACDDCKVRAYDVETQKLIMELTDHKMPLEVCKANEEYIVSGGQDGNVVVYDASLRSHKPIVSFAQGKSTITALDISRDSTWVSAGSVSAPSVYNLKNSAILPQMFVDKPQRIYTVHFDKLNNLWFGGGGGRIFKSQNLTTISCEMKAIFGAATIHHVYSITTTNPNRVSAAGSSTGILFSENADYWEGMVHI